ncbi:MAG: flagella basal body P-ring formation protein FlgA [Novosphingobium sp.]
MAAVCATSLAFFAEAEIRGEVLHLGDVIDTAALPADLALQARHTGLLRVGREILQTAIPRRELAAQARARLPQLAECLAGIDGDPVVVRRHVAAEAPRVTARDAEGIAKGEQVTVRIASTSFAIERTGLAASAAKPGEQVFVRTPDGAVIRAVVGTPAR